MVPIERTTHGQCVAPAIGTILIIGGSISVESEIGVGTKFTIMIKEV